MPYFIQSSKDMYMRIMGVEKKNEEREKQEDKQKEEDTKVNSFMPMNLSGMPYALPTSQPQVHNTFSTVPNYGGGNAGGFSGFGANMNVNPNQTNNGPGKLPFIG